MTFTTADLCDKHASATHFQIVEPIFKYFGTKAAFSGKISTVKAFEDSVLIGQILAETVTQRILVIDGGGSHRCALLDYDLINTAYQKGWQGIIIYGCLRNTDKINQLPIGIRALHAHPLKSHNKGTGERDNPINFAGTQFKTDHYLYADNDGIVISQTSLL